MLIKTYQQADKPTVLALKQLESVCKNHDGTSIPIYWDVLSSHRESAKDFYGYEKYHLVAYFSAFSFSDDEYEISAMVHPDYRQRGFFSTCLEQIRILAKQEGIKRFMFALPENVVSSEKALKAVGADYYFTEYTLQRANKKELPVIGSEKTALIEANITDCHLLASLDARCFDSNEEVMCKRFTATMNDKNRCVWLFMLGEKPIGKIHCRFENEVAVLHDLCILPSEQGGGYGLCMLQETLKQLLSMPIDNVRLTVRADNSSALKLYQKVGFETELAHQYFRLSF